MKLNTIFLKVSVLGILLLYSCVPKHPIALEKNSIFHHPKVVYGTLFNGLQYVLLENNRPEKRVNLHLNIFAGSLHETEQEKGIAHYLEHMLFNGSDHYQPGELIEYFKSIGMDFGADANARTSYYNTIYDLSLPEGSSEQIDKALEIIEDYAKGALLLEDEIDRERGIILAEKRERDSVSYRTYKKSVAFELPGSILSQSFPIGSEKIINNADQRLLKNFYDKWYRPDNMALIVVGDFDSSLVQNKIKKRFSKLKSRTPFTPVLLKTKWENHTGLKSFYHYEPEAGNTTIAIKTLAWQSFRSEEIDDIKQTVLNNMAGFLLRQRQSRMISNQKAGFTEASAYMGSYLRNISISTITATCDPDKWNESLKQIEYLLRQALQFGFTQKELDRVKIEYVSAIESQLDKTDSQDTSYLSRDILSAINNKKLFLSPKQEYDLLIPFIKKVSLESVHKTLKKAWAKKHRLILVKGNAKIISDEPEKDIIYKYELHTGKSVKPYLDLVSKEFPYLDIEKLDQENNIKKKTLKKDFNVTSIALSNNIQLYLKETDYIKNEFAFNAVFGDGRLSIPFFKPGLDRTASVVVDESGFGQLKLEEIQDAIAGRKLSVEFGIRENYFSFSGTADPKEAELIFQLLYHFFKDPGFREEPLTLFKNKYAQKYNEFQRSPDGIMQISGFPFLAGNDPRFGMPSPKIIKNYALQDIKDWLNPYLKDSPIEISMVGDFKTDSIIKLFEKYFKGFNTRSMVINQKMNQEMIRFPKGETLDLMVNSKIDTGAVRVAFQTDDFWNIKQTRRLLILASIISERLREVLREELGETYSPYVYNYPSIRFKKYGIFEIVVNVHPDNHESVYKKIFEIVNTLDTEPVTKKETEAALKIQLNQLKEYRRTNSYWLYSVLSHSSVYPEKFDWASNMMDDYKSIKSEEINQLADEYLKIEDSARIFIRPELKRVAD